MNSCVFKCLPSTSKCVDGILMKAFWVCMEPSSVQHKLFISAQIDEATYMPATENTVVTVTMPFSTQKHYNALPAPVCNILLLQLGKQSS